MIEFLIENINIDENKEEFFNEIEETVLKKGFEFIILKTHKFRAGKIKQIINEVKKHFDIFIILKIKFPSSSKELEHYFSAGSHGVIFTEDFFEGKIELKLLYEAVKLFPRGTVFYENEIKDENFISNLIDENVIPIIKSCNMELFNFVEKKLDKKRGLKGYLKFIPLLGQLNCEYEVKERGLKDKVEKKIILELNNLRHKLMIKEVEESFNSSSL